MNKNLLKQAQQLQAQLAKAQEELSKAVYEASSGGGAVTVIIDGQQKVQSVKISPEAINPEDVELLEDMVMTAINEAVTRSKEAAAQQLGGLTAGLNIPGLM